MVKLLNDIASSMYNISVGRLDIHAEFHRTGVLRKTVGYIQVKVNDVGSNVTRVYEIRQFLLGTRLDTVLICECRYNEGSHRIYPFWTQTRDVLKDIEDDENRNGAKLNLTKYFDEAANFLRVSNPAGEKVDD